MRQRDGSDLLGPGNPRSADISILYVEADDTRQTILTAIATQDKSGRKQIAIVLPEQRKAFLQPVDFDGLKDMRRTLKSQLVFIAPPGPGPAAFARQRRFQVYSSLESFKTELVADGSGSRPGGSKPGILGFGSRRSRSAPPPRSRNRTGPVQSPDRSASVAPGERRSVASPPPSDPISDVKTVETASPASNRSGVIEAGALGLAAGAGLGALAAHEDDEDGLYPPSSVPNVAPPQHEDEALSEDEVPPVGPPRQQPDPVAQSSGGAVPPGAIGFAPLPGSISARRTVPISPAGQAKTDSGSLKAMPDGSKKGGRVVPLPVPIQMSSAVSPVSPGSTLNPPPGVSRPPDPQPQPAASPAAHGQSSAAGGPPRAVNAGVVAGAGVGAMAATSMAARRGAPVAPAPPVRGGGVGGGGGAGAPPPRRRRSRLLLVIVLLLLILLLVGGVAFAAQQSGGVSSIFQTNPAATVTITPASKLEQNRYLVTGVLSGTPNAAKYQVQERSISATSPAQSATGDATGKTDAHSATGILTFQNLSASNVTFSAGTTFTGTSGVTVATNFSVVVPATGSATATVSAHAVKPGLAGNIPTLDILQTCCQSNVRVRNGSAFSGGTDAITLVAAGDAQRVANSLKTPLTQGAKTALQPKVSSNERVVDKSLACDTPTVVSSNHKVGDQVNTLTVSATITCSETVYDYAAVQAIGRQLLQASAQHDTALQPSPSAWALAGDVITNVVGTNIVSASQQVEITVEAEGLWVYQFTSAIRTSLEHGLVKLTKSAALAYLLQQPGIVGPQDVQIAIDNNGNVLPADPTAIKLVIKGPPGLQSTPTATGTGTGGTNVTPLPTPGTLTPTLPSANGS